MISFRLSEEEYTDLRTVCENEGARSVSDLARDAVHRLVRKQSNAPVETILMELRGRVDSLDLQVQRLSLAVGESETKHMRQSNGKL